MDRYLVWYSFFPFYFRTFWKSFRFRLPSAVKIWWNVQTKTLARPNCSNFHIRIDLIESGRNRRNDGISYSSRFHRRQDIRALKSKRCLNRIPKFSSFEEFTRQRTRTRMEPWPIHHNKKLSRQHFTFRAKLSTTIKWTTVTSSISNHPQGRKIYPSNTSPNSRTPEKFHRI